MKIGLDIGSKSETYVDLNTMNLIIVQLLGFTCCRLNQNHNFKRELLNFACVNKYLIRYLLTEIVMR